MSVLDDEQRRRAEHLDACWQGCDDLHDDVCPHCELPDCSGECQEADAGYWSDVTGGQVVTERAFTERELL